jgi:hypothetical protein
MRWLIAILLIIHGLIHAGVATAPDPSKGEASEPFQFFLGEDRSWLLRVLGVSDNVSWWIALTMIALTTLGFIIAGALLMVKSSMWREFAIGTSVLSLLFIVAYWNRYLPVGVAVNVGVVVALAWAHWPGEDLIGA